MQDSIIIWLMTTRAFGVMHILFVRTRRLGSMITNLDFFSNGNGDLGQCSSFGFHSNSIFPLKQDLHVILDRKYISPSSLLQFIPVLVALHCHRSPSPS